MSTIADIADAVVAALNGHAFSPSPSPPPGVPAGLDLKDMKDLHVTVVPKGVEMSTAGPGWPQSDVQIDVAVQKKLGPRATTRRSTP